MPGPLEGFRAVEVVGLGPGPFCGMLLADMGAEVLRVDRVDAARAVDHSKPATSAMDRGKQAVAIDLKQPDGVEALLRLMESADAFFEVFRPGVAERLGIGPDDALTRNPRLVYGRLTGWGQAGIVLLIILYLMFAMPRMSAKTAALVSLIVLIVLIVA